MDKEFNDIKELALKLNILQKEQYNYLKELVFNIINNNVRDENEIMIVFDRLLDLVYWYGKDIEETYYLLLNYYKYINLEVSNDYKKYYLNIIKESKK